MAESDNKVSATKIMERLDSLQAAFDRFVRPESFLVYKPMKDISKGRAFKAQYRMSPAKTDKGFQYYTGGCFIEVVPQMASSGEYAEFGWRPATEGADPPGVSAKLGVPDISAMLLAYRYQRFLGRGIPERMRPVTKIDGKFQPSKEENVLALTHKFENTTTVIKWDFRDGGSYLEIAKSGGKKFSVSFTLAEEIAVTKYLDLALEALLVTGV